MAVSIPGIVQAALYDRLTSHIAAAGQLWPVYDHIPAENPVSCVQIGLVATQTDDILAAPYSLVVVSIICWSTYNGQKEAHAMNAEVRAALHERDLPLASGAAYHVVVDRQFVDRDPSVEGYVYTGNTIVTIKVEH